MSKCDLQILFDRPDRRYKFGEPMSGALKISAQEDFHCRKLTLIREWKTAGRGNHASGGEEGMILADDAEFHAGEIREYPFHFVGLLGPVSYQGNYLQVDWQLRAQVDIPLAVDVKREEKFLLVPDATAEEIILGSETPSKDIPVTAGELAEQMTMAKMLAVPFFFIGLAMIYLSGWHPVALALGLAVTAFGAWQMFLKVRNKLAQRKIGAVDVQVQPETLHPGQQLECTILLPVWHAKRLQKVTVTLKGEERVVSGLGNHKTTHAHTIHEYGFELTNSNAVPVEKHRMQFRQPLSIPATAPSTFRAPDNALHWAVRVRLYIPDWPDWVQEFPITVLP